MIKTLADLNLKHTHTQAVQCFRANPITQAKQSRCVIEFKSFPYKHQGKGGIDIQDYNSDWSISPYISYLEPVGNENSDRGALNHQVAISRFQ